MLQSQCKECVQESKREEPFKAQALLKSFSRGVPDSANGCAVKVYRVGIRNANTEHGEILW